MSAEVVVAACCVGIVLVRECHRNCFHGRCTLKDLVPSLIVDGGTPSELVG